MTTLASTRPVLFRRAIRSFHSAHRRLRSSAFLPPAPLSPLLVAPLYRSSIPRAFSVSARACAQDVEAPDHLSEGELAIFEKIKKELEPTRLEVQDISGGCGSMYGLDIVSPKFKGMTTIKQHKLVNGILKEELKQWHGMQLKTKAE